MSPSWSAFLYGGLVGVAIGVTLMWLLREIEERRAERRARGGTRVIDMHAWNRARRAALKRGRK